MSTVMEIESAIEKLPAQKVEELAAWFEEYRSTLNSSDSVFLAYDEEESR
ncbi:MAG: hypothetical protein WC661_07155 [Opitutaceae bacterium]|jgi:hypothetical protein